MKGSLGGLHKSEGKLRVLGIGRGPWALGWEGALGIELCRTRWPPGLPKWTGP